MHEYGRNMDGNSNMEEITLKKGPDRAGAAGIIKRNNWESLIFVVLMLYPLRHIYWGLDLWDTGYNYANFQYMGLEHMDPMWLFSTYLANAAGHFLTGLPGAGTLAGMNLYTGLLVSLLAVTGYLFCTRALKWDRLPVFLGEMAAISLCWCPTALLYNYLTYVLFLAGVILLYLGLTKNKRRFLFAAGVCLGMNVLVRFSNLPQAGMILAVWCYVIIERLEIKRGLPFGDRETAQKHIAEMMMQRRGLAVLDNRPGRFLRSALFRTFWCLGGYLSALAVLLGYLHLRYGITDYVNGIRRLLAMTDNATDYKAASMLTGLIECYVENLYWAVRIGCIAAVGAALMAVVLWCIKRTGELRIWEKAAALPVIAAIGWLYYRIFGDFLKSGFIGNAFFAAAFILLVTILAALASLLLRSEKKIPVLLTAAAELFCALLAVTMVCWLYYRGFSSSMEFWHYGAILRPGVLFLMLAMGMAVIQIFRPGCSREEKLISSLVVLVILLTSLGSNNKVYPSLNNLFVAAPYVLTVSWKFLEWGAARLAGGTRSGDSQSGGDQSGDSQSGGTQPRGDQSGNSQSGDSQSRNSQSGGDQPRGTQLKGTDDAGRHEKPLLVLPFKCILIAFLGVFLFQSAGFGICFVFAEATGVQDISAAVENNEVLAGIRMSRDKAQWMTEISAYVEENNLQGREVILYGYIPSLSYYLQMPSSFNPWSDLRSYHLEVMIENLQKVQEEITDNPGGRPVVLVEKRYGLYYEGGRKALEAAGMSQEDILSVEQDKKWMALTDFLQNQQYEITFDNDKFVIWE